ncbi:hypothetical protein Selli1_33430 [Sellimonas catena]|uniref:Uncharacterized protein n=1 Tax=Sellimonas catena TaxID=2994035 RepID=A0A9W6C831_9FIRM|nr:hypothetical protein Selli1_33430 [Sellimonas catena]
MFKEGVKQNDRNRQIEYRLLCNTYRNFYYMSCYCKKNETPVLEVSDCMDLVYGFNWGFSFNISLKLLTIRG